MADHHNSSVETNKLQILGLSVVNDSSKLDTPSRCFHVGPILSPRVLAVLEDVISLSEALISHTFNDTEAGTGVTINPIPDGLTSPLAVFCRTSKWASDSCTLDYLTELAVDRFSEDFDRGYGCIILLQAVYYVNAYQLLVNAF